MTHECFAPNCATVMSDRKLACPHHWWQLPANLRDKINREYQAHGISARLQMLQGEAFAFWTAKLAKTEGE